MRVTSRSVATNWMGGANHCYGDKEDSMGKIINSFGDILNVRSF